MIRCFQTVADPAMGEPAAELPPIPQFATEQNLGLVVAARNSLSQTRRQVFILILNFRPLFCMKMDKKLPICTRGSAPYPIGPLWTLPQNHSSRIRFLRLFENPKKRDFLRFFEAAFKKNVKNVIQNSKF